MGGAGAGPGRRLVLRHGRRKGPELTQLVGALPVSRRQPWDFTLEE